MQDDNSTTTTELTYGRYCSTFPMPPTPCDIDHRPPIQPDCIGHAGDDGTGDDAGYLPLDRHRRQLPHCPALFRYRDPVGHPVLGVLSSACVPSQDVYLLVGDEVVATKAGQH